MARVWLVRSLRALTELLEKGRLCGERGYVDEDFRHSYNWMRTQMRKRIGSGPRGAYPVWVWYQYSDAKRPRPDLRHTCHLAKGTQGVRIELEVPEEQLLLSDFDLWHFPLNGWYLPSSLEDEERFDNLVKDYRESPTRALKLRRMIERSWTQIFDLNFAPSDIANIRDLKSIQGCIWEISVDQVINVDTFIAR